MGGGRVLKAVYRTFHEREDIRLLDTYMGKEAHWMFSQGLGGEERPGSKH